MTAELAISAIDSVMIALAITILIPGLVLFIECIAAIFPNRSFSVPPQLGNVRFNILVPAHNEALGIESTIQTLRSQLSSSDRLVVVADNCSDNTADVARKAGATVIERYDSERRGKGYALDFGVRSMVNDPPDVVVIIDADCHATSGSLAKLVQAATATQKPVQGIYLIESPKPLSTKNAVSTLAITVKNWVRFAGLKNLGLSCLLTGTGMAMPWEVIQTASLASGNIVEDMNLGIDLAIGGHNPVFCPEAKFTSVLPQKEQAAKTQRTRWEHGHLQTIKTQVPRLLQASIQQQRPDLFILALDLLVPPLSLLVIGWIVAFIIGTVTFFLGLSPLPLVILGITGVMIAIAILSAWAKYCRQDLPAKILLSIPLYIFWKIPLYFEFLIKPQKTWIRTERDAKPQFTRHKS